MISECPAVFPIIKACLFSSPEIVMTKKNKQNHGIFQRSHYPNNQKCTWLFNTTQPDQFVKLKISFELLGEGDYIELRDGLNENAVLLKNITSETAHAQYEYSFISSAQFIWVQFKSDKEFIGHELGLSHNWWNVPKACSSASPEIVMANNSVQNISLFDGYDYPNSQRCTWLFTATQPFQLINLKITIGCLARGDYIELRDGLDESAVLLKNITDASTINSDKVNSFISSSRLMLVTFKSDKEFTGGGILLSYKWLFTPKACLPSSLYERVDINKASKIKSPFAPNTFINSKLDCTWLAAAKENQLIRLQLEQFDLTQTGDYVEVRDGLDESDMVLMNFNVNSNQELYNETWLSSGRFLLVKLRTDGRQNIEEFILSLKAVDKPKACTDQLPLIETDRQPITSPFYPSFYPNKQECTWVITAPELDQIIAFKMEDFDLAQPGDYVEVLNEPDGVVLYNFTNKLSVPDKYRTSSGKIIRVKFKSDQRNTAKGFKMSIRFQTKVVTSLPPSTALVMPSITKISTSAVVGIGLGTGVLVLFVLFVLIKIKKKIHSKNRNPANDPWEVTLCQIELLEEIGHGAFGKVWKGCIDKSGIENNKTADKVALIQKKKGSAKDVVVAVKMLRESASLDEQNEFLGEIEFMKNVGYHRNIISMVACCTKVEQVFLVVEYAKHGDLLKLLRDKRNKTYVKIRPSTNEQTPNSSENDGENQSVESLLEELMSFSWQIAQGMEYLSSKGIVHRDLAARNVLLAEDLLVKVADFGLSRHLTYEEQVYKAHGRRKLPLKWMSPEALDEQIFTSKSDVWSYGVVLWEIYSLGKPPYPTISNQQLLASLKEGYRMEKPDICLDEIYELMRNCWQERAQGRPSFSDVIQCVEALMTRDKPYFELMEVNEQNVDECLHLVQLVCSVSESEVAAVMV